MRSIELVLGVALCLAILWEAFETIILPRSIRRQFRFTRFYYRSTWKAWSALARRLPSGPFRESVLGTYGPLSGVLLVGWWAAGLIFAFALIFAADDPSDFSGRFHEPDFVTRLYFSASSFFTLGLGDVTPATTASRLTTVIEAGVGFGFLALVISYLPLLYQSFSRRELAISLLDARAGSPPSGVALLLRHRHEGGLKEDLLPRWEAWAADVLETHLSYPVLAYFRSQHQNQSWLAALTAILDACAILICCVEDDTRQQARFTFAIARHAMVDLAQVFGVTPSAPKPERLTPADFAMVASKLWEAGIAFDGGSDSEAALTWLRSAYEPEAAAIASYLVLDLPGWLPTPELDDWQSTPWGDDPPFAI